MKGLFFNQIKQLPMKTTIKIISIILVLSFSNSCEKEWLEMEPKGKKLEANFYQTEQELFDGLMAAYDMLQIKYGPPWSSYYFMANFPSDDSKVVGGGPGDRPEYHDIGQFQTTATNPAIEELWRREYNGIYRANIIINSDEINSSLAQRYKAEAKFLRAYYYFELIRFYGDVPLILNTLSPDEYGQEKTDKNIIYEQLEKDLKQATADLPAKSSLSSYELGRVTKGAAQSLLGKIYLYQEKFQDAADMLKNVVDLEGDVYQLEDDFDKIWKASGENGPESIFEIQYSSITERGDWNWGRANEGNIDVQMSGPRMTDTDTLNSGWGFDMVTQDLISAYRSEDDSARMHGTAYGAAFLNGIGASSWEENEGYTGWFSKKRAPWASYTAAVNTEWNYGTNERMIRLADVKLMYAEALNRGMINDAEALAQVNDIRERAVLPPLTGVSGDALFEAIKKERRLELAMEGHRFFDLVRWGDAAEVLGPLGFEEGKHEVFPIPQGEIDKSNGKLTQNDNY